MNKSQRLYIWMCSAIIALLIFFAFSISAAAQITINHAPSTRNWESGDVIYSAFMCSDLDVVKKITIAAMEDMKDAEKEFVSAMHIGSCANFPVRVPFKMLEKMYSYQDADGDNMEVWSFHAIFPDGREGEEDFYLWAYSDKGPSSTNGKGIINPNIRSLEINMSKEIL
jgi:hypothetical protein